MAAVARTGRLAVYFIDFISVRHAIARYMLSPVRLSVCLSVSPSVCHTGGSVKNAWS